MVTEHHVSLRRAASPESTLGCDWSVPLLSLFTSVNTNNNTNTNGLFIAVRSWLRHCESSPGSCNECTLSSKRPLTLRPSQSTRAVSLPIGCHHLQPPSLFITIIRSKGWYLFYHPTEGRRLSLPIWPAAYRGGFTCQQTVTHPYSIARPDVE